ncbi:hypothetical protein ACFYW8_03695 [Streptomyces sp. NPDC002742]|uniref:hypothetical protein n=1 Tax=Streptomyces sp. NPDC002742 TaxID=3364663 RepID=UPI0036ADC634
MKAADTTVDTRPVPRAGHVAAFGLLLTAGALFERVNAWSSGRQYVFCHASEAVDRLTYTALGLVLSAGALSTLGAIALWWNRTRSTRLHLACMIAVVAVLMAADGVDAHGERRAATIAAERPADDKCDYTPQDYTATPGWFYW